MKLATEMKVTAVANWFGSARQSAQRVGEVMGKRSLIIVPFAGGMSELPYFDAPKMVVNDRHRHVINLARVLADHELGPELYRRLRRAAFHPDTLSLAQTHCSILDVQFAEMDSDNLFDRFAIGELNRIDSGGQPDLNWAYSYAICTWMGRGGNSGTTSEFGGSLPIRYSPNGGGSAQRFSNWVASIPAWRRTLRKCEFSTDDALKMIAAGHDDTSVGYYVDAPWPDAGDGYAVRFSERNQRALAGMLALLSKSRIVVRFGDHPLIRQLYPRDRWQWIEFDNRAQSNGTFKEVLLVKGGGA